MHAAQSGNEGALSFDVGQFALHSFFVYLTTTIVPRMSGYSQHQNIFKLVSGQVLAPVYTSVGFFDIPIDRFDITCTDGRMDCASSPPSCAALFPIFKKALETGLPYALPTFNVTAQGLDTGVWGNMCGFHVFHTAFTVLALIPLGLAYEAYRAPTGV
jgi:hypothetical protein